MSVKIIRLLSGEEIICNLTVNNNDTVTVKDPSILIPSPEGKLLLAKWIPYGNVQDGITINTRNIIFTVDPQKELSDHFTNVVVNNLVVPGKKLIDPSTSGLKLSV
jgi:hypothetical protein